MNPQFSSDVEVIEFSGEVIRLKSWDEFKRLAMKFKPKYIVYNIEQSVPARELTGIRLILPP